MVYMKACHPVFQLLSSIPDIYLRLVEISHFTYRITSANVTMILGMLEITGNGGTGILTPW